MYGVAQGGRVVGVFAFDGDGERPAAGCCAAVAEGGYVEAAGGGVEGQGSEGEGGCEGCTGCCEESGEKHDGWMCVCVFLSSCCCCCSCCCRYLK